MMVMVVVMIMMFVAVSHSWDHMKQAVQVFKLCCLSIFITVAF